jgi:hypothetical protein
MKLGEKVKSIKMFGLAALAALMAMAFVGASSAMAEATQLCSGDPTGSGCGTSITHVHESTLPGEANQAILLSNILNVKCDVLYLGDTLGSLANSGIKLVIHGHFTYTNCNNSCTVTEESTNSLVEVEKRVHETASVVGSGEVRVHCGFFINCVYNFVGLEATAHGPLLSNEINGDATILGQEMNKVEGFCPEHVFLDIKTTPLTATYIGS